MKVNSKKYNKKTRNKTRNIRKGTRKNNKKGRGIFKKIFRKDFSESLISKKSRKEEEYSQMSNKELIENIEILLEEAAKVEQLENLLNIYSDFFNKDNISTLIGALADAMYYQNIMKSEESITIKQEYRKLISKLHELLENIS
tara:strand:- start:5983 stop:6411 length:429 start_codon:yes stop_codon:yes gene_type:complete